jgi:hypothetical protein
MLELATGYLEIFDKSFLLFLMLKDESRTLFRDFNLAIFAGAFSSSQPGVQLPVLAETFCGFLSPVYLIQHTALN